MDIGKSKYSKSRFEEFKNYFVLLLNFVANCLGKVSAKEDSMFQ